MPRGRERRPSQSHATKFSTRAHIYVVKVSDVLPAAQEFGHLACMYMYSAHTQPHLEPSHGHGCEGCPYSGIPAAGGSGREGRPQLGFCGGNCPIRRGRLCGWISKLALLASAPLGPPCSAPTAAQQACGRVGPTSVCEFACGTPSRHAGCAAVDPPTTAGDRVCPPPGPAAGLSGWTLQMSSVACKSAVDVTLALVNLTTPGICHRRHSWRRSFRPGLRRGWYAAHRGKYMHTYTVTPRVCALGTYDQSIGSGQAGLQVGWVGITAANPDVT